MTARPPGETILLVEDEMPIRVLIRRALEGQGYQLLEAGDGEEALDLAADQSGHIDLLITDIVMPGMDGFTLCERLAESHPETRILFLSGEADRSVAMRGGLTVRLGRRFLLKPFTYDRLLRTIRDLLDTEPDRRAGPDETGIR